MSAVNDFEQLIAGLQGDSTRVVWGGGDLSDAALGARVRACAETLAASGARRIASRLDNGPEWLVLDLAIRALDAVHVPLPTFFAPQQIAHALRDSGADLLVQPSGAPLPEGVTASEPSPAILLDDGLCALRLAGSESPLPAGTACISYTSGTTGAPKGVCLDVSALYTVARSLAVAPGSLAPRRHLCLMPLSTLLENIAGVYAALMSGAEIAVPTLAEIGYRGDAGLDAHRLLACLQRYRPESAIVLPQLLLALVMAVEQGAPWPDSLRFLAVGGGRVGTALLARAQALGIPVYEGYGLSECGSVVCLNRPDAIRLGSVGRPLPHAKVSVVDGELWVDGARSLGYLGETAMPSGPIATGDLGHIDADGFVYVTGRRKHLIITSYGRNLSPEWVESELLQHPAIAQAVVFGEARPFNVAVIWPRRETITRDALREALAAINRDLPAYAQVRDAVRADAPFRAADGLLTANGRPKRDAIAARYRAASDACYRNADIPTIEGVIA
ncbi:MAG: long-chain acyl-CoA synthetase [Lysobacteraceae bacterium]|nr:MAG: long-chain acyl-CoA synthetase [Xanthomonadaceae bacterium]